MTGRLVAWTRRIERWWDGLSDVDRIHVHGLGLCTALYLAHFAVFSWWYIEDAAISFAFAQNAANGLGFVVWPGGERVEGFSNPTWTLLLAALHTVGINPWIAAKWLGATLGVGTLAASLAWARRLLPGEPHAPLLAPFLLATSLQFVLWNASGLENGLFVLLLSVGCLGMLREIDHRRAPWSALAWSLLAITRPEGPMYAAVAGTAGFFLALARQGDFAILWAVRWLVLFAGPFATWHAWRYDYFAWEFPNTYYAKLAEAKKFEPFSWTTRGWKYLREFALWYGHGFLIPVYALGLTGTRGRRAWVAMGALAIGLVLVLPDLAWIRHLPGWPDKIAVPAGFAQARIAWIALTAALVPLLGAGRSRQGDRWLAVLLVLTALFFAVYSGGDWMKGHRWLSLAAVPMMVLLADGTATVGKAVFGRFGATAVARFTVTLLVLVPSSLGIGGTVAFLTGPETSPYDVRRRVLYMQGVQDRLHLDHVTLLDVDMGAHMWWSGFEIVDLAGLVDVPMGHHKWQPEFFRQYVFAERNPEFLHLHGSWAGKRTNTPTRHPEYKRYIEIEPFPISPWVSHAGNHVRRDLFIVKKWQGGTERTARFAEEISLVGLDVPAPTVAAGEELYVELGMRGTDRVPDFRVLLFLSGPGGKVVRELPPGYDWYTPKSWTDKDVVLGRHSLTLPPDLAVGDYDLGLVVLETGSSGSVIPFEEAVGAVTEPPAVARGEVRWVGAVHVVAAEVARAEADRLLDQASSSARSGNCKTAEREWQVARRHLARANPWQTDAHRRLAPEMASCHAADAEAATRRVTSVDALVAARRWQHDHPELLRVGAALADRWTETGAAAEQRGDAKAAYEAFRDAMVADPTRSWLRRRTEAARDRLLGLSADDEGPEVSDDAGGD